MSTYVSEKTKQIVKLRAASICEYCLIHEDFLFTTCHIDHIISIKHGGESDLTNLAFCCSRCNWNKGSDLGSILKNPEKIIRFFHPRKDNWFSHFELLENIIKPLTPIGEVTLKILQLNTLERIEERKLLEELFPHRDTPNFEI